MKKLLYLMTIVLCFGIFSCKTLKQTTYGIQAQRVVQLFNDTISTLLMDSICEADFLPVLPKWKCIYLRDADNKPYRYYTLYDPTSFKTYSVKALTDKKLYIMMIRQITTK